MRLSACLFPTRACIVWRWRYRDPFPDGALTKTLSLDPQDFGAENKVGKAMNQEQRKTAWVLICGRKLEVITKMKTGGYMLISLSPPTPQSYT